VIRTYVEKKRTPRKISQKKSHDKRPFVEKSKIELGDLVMINQHKKKPKFQKGYTGPFQVIGNGNSKSHIIVDISKETKEFLKVLKDVKPYVIYIGHARLYKKNPNPVVLETDFDATKFNQEKYRNKKVGSFPVEVLAEDENSGVFISKFASGDVAIVKSKKGLHPKLLKDFKKKEEVRKLEEEHLLMEVTHQTQTQVEQQVQEQQVQEHQVQTQIEHQVRTQIEQQVQTIEQVQTQIEQEVQTPEQQVQTPEQQVQATVEQQVKKQKGNQILPLDSRIRVGEVQVDLQVQVGKIQVPLGNSDQHNQVRTEVRRSSRDKHVPLNLKSPEEAKNLREAFKKVVYKDGNYK